MVLARLQGGDAEPELLGREAAEAFRPGRTGTGFEAAAWVDDPHSFFRVVRKDPEKVPPAVFGDRDDPVGAQTGIERASKTTSAIRFRRPGRLLEVAQIVQGVYQPGGLQFRAKEIVGVVDVGGSQLLLEVRLRVAPKSLRALETRRRPGAPEIRPAGRESRLGAIRVPEHVSDGRIEHVTVLPVNLGQLADQAIGEIPATRLRAAGLADIEADRHLFTRPGSAP